jgi:hypothetical protein
MGFLTKIYGPEICNLLFWILNAMTVREVSMLPAHIRIMDAKRISNATKKNPYLIDNLLESPSQLPAVSIIVG